MLGKGKNWGPGSCNRKRFHMVLSFLDNLAGSTGTMKVMGQWGEPGLLAMQTCCPPLKPNPPLL